MLQKTEAHRWSLGHHKSVCSCYCPHTVCLFIEPGVLHLFQLYLHFTFGEIVGCFLGGRVSILLMCSASVTLLPSSFWISSSLSSNQSWCLLVFRPRWVSAVSCTVSLKATQAFSAPLAPRSSRSNLMSRSLTRFFLKECLSILPMLNHLFFVFPCGRRLGWMCKFSFERMSLWSLSPAVCTAHCLRQSDIMSVSSSDNNIDDHVPVFAVGASRMFC